MIDKNLFIPGFEPEAQGYGSGIPVITTPININNRRYIGNKTKLNNWIFENIKKVAGDAISFCDPFGGTGAVANEALKRGFKKVFVNDVLPANICSYNAFIGPGKWNKSKIMAILNEWGKINKKGLDENYCSMNYGHETYFDELTARAIGYIREDIERLRPMLTEKEYYILIAILLYSMDKVANTTGTYDSYLKIKNHKEFKLRMISPYSYDGVKIYQGDANDIIKGIESDIVYLDPPYNSRQYGRLYNLPDKICKWDKEELEGKTAKSRNTFRSKYSTRMAAKEMRDLINKINAKWIFTSYNNNFNAKDARVRNKIGYDEMLDILSTRGDTSVAEMPYNPYNAGRTKITGNKELLFITRVR